jgi:hypothetical protein
LKNFLISISCLSAKAFYVFEIKYYYGLFERRAIVMKKVLSVFLALAMLLPVLPLDTIPVSALQSGDYIYTISGNPSRASITGYTGAGGNITIPLQLDIYPVAFIGYKAFYNCTSLTSVNILDNILEVDEYAFYYCTELKSVTFGSNVGKIDNYAFY